MILRPYQRRAVDDIFGYFAEHSGDPVAILPTAAGKSVIIATFIREAIEAHASTRVIVLTHVAKLLKQNAEKLLSVWPQAPLDFYSASVGRKNTRAQVLFAGIQSIYKHAYAIQQCDIILIDECHLVSPNEVTRYRHFLKEIRAINPHCKVVGFTASPWRLDSGMIYGEANSLFTDCCHETTIPELIAGGFLCPITTKRTSEQLDVSGVKSRGGEFIAGDLQIAVDREAVTRACVDEIVALPERPGLLFATGVKHAYHIRDEVRARGYSCEVIDGDTDETQRDKWITDMMAGRLDYLSNCGTLTTGIDIPNLRMIGDLAPTKSPALHTQKLGRLMRLSPGKERGIVLDFARNVDFHGPIDLIRPKPKGEKGDGEMPVKICPECGSKLHPTVRICPDCDYAFPLPAPTFQATAGSAPILSTQIEPEWVRVRGVSYSAHMKARPSRADQEPALTLKITYDCGLVSHTEWQCPEHEGYARRKFEAWWQSRGCNPMPNSVALALERKDELRTPSRIKVIKDGKYMRVIGYDFGEQEGMVA